ncbi:hypothetical protein SEA_GAIL_82 [Mycobacterium phage Gail]|uniref:Uncharacterized protein n=1 Tax=Mycobacterium phage Gail TaxID=2743994 RepID=A0A7D5FS82_9CAUD|nr:hypothetical protein KNV16_gp027 [Mycobacterium phage Gail]QLF84645.1 hypothetical protein SEA_GAIL_82 [Mycobacterium phage Gail]
MEERHVDVAVLDQVFECRVLFWPYKIEVTTGKVPGWRKAHRRVAKREGFDHLWITHIEHDPHVGDGKGGVVTTTWEN